MNKASKALLEKCVMGFAWSCAAGATIATGISFDQADKKYPAGLDCLRLENDNLPCPEEGLRQKDLLLAERASLQGPFTLALLLSTVPLLSLPPLPARRAVEKGAKKTGNPPPPGRGY